MAVRTVQFALCCLLLAAALGAARADDGAAARTRTFRCTQRVFRLPDTLVVKDVRWFKFVLVTTLPSSNPWQTVTNIRCSAGQALEDPETGQRYYRLQQATIPSEVVVEYDIVVPVPQSARVFAPVTAYRGRPAPAALARYTNAQESVDPRHPFVARRAAELGREAGDDLDYCRRAYRWQQAAFRHDGRHRGSLDRVIAERAGECADLSGLYVSLVRARGIPARLFVGGIWRDGAWSTHVWPAFWLDGPGWIPADPSYFLPVGGYFGKLVNGSYLALAERDPQPIAVDTGAGIEKMVLPGISYWYWRGGGTRTGSLSMKREVTVRPLD